MKHKFCLRKFDSCSISLVFVVWFDNSRKIPLVSVYLYWDAVYYAVQGGSNFWVSGWNPEVWSFKWTTEQYFRVMPFIMLYKVVLTFESVDVFPKCDHSKESFWAVLSCGIAYFFYIFQNEIWYFS